MLQIQYNEVTYATTFENYTMLTGNIVSLGMGGIICIVTSLIFPEDYDFVSMKKIRMLDEDLDGDMGFSKVGHARSSSSYGNTLQCMLQWLNSGKSSAISHKTSGMLDCDRCRGPLQTCILLLQWLNFGKTLAISHKISSQPGVLAYDRCRGHCNIDPAVSRTRTSQSRCRDSC